MAHIRTIRPAFFRDRRLYLAERSAGMPLRIAWAALWTVSDREGRFRWHPEELRLDCLPYDDIDFSAVLDVLAEHGFVVRYDVGGQSYGYIPSWREHQKVNTRESGSKLPAPPAAGHAHTHAEGERGSMRRHGLNREATAPSKNNDAGVNAKSAAGLPPRRESMITPSPITMEAMAVADEIMRLAGIDPDNPPPTWCGASLRVQAWLARGWQRDVVMAAVRGVLARARDDPPGSIVYFEPAIMREHERQSRPGKAGGREEIESPVSASIRRHIERGLRFGPRPSDRPRTGGAAGRSG